MRIVILDGTPEELQGLPQFEQLIAQAGRVLPGLDGDTPPIFEGNYDRNVVTADMVLRVLRVKPLHLRQRKLITALVEAGAAGLTIARLETAIGGRIGGVKGGFGLRCKQVRGWPKRNATGVRPSEHLFIRETDAHNVVRYRASAALIEAWARYQTER